MDEALEEAVRRRAGYLCEYCLMPQSVRRLRFPIDHIIARQHGGKTLSDNLALCCGRCNRHKGPNVAGIDPETDQLVPLFNPRRDPWEQHFHWDGPNIVGVTAIGRATATVLSLNHPDEIAVRLTLIERGMFPPEISKH